jgi:hypothetical protein
MNEQIKELEDQASQYASRETTDLDEWEFIFRKKFAELIVKKCAAIASNTNLEDVDGGDSAVLGAAREQILEHFGVGK